MTDYGMSRETQDNGWNEDQLRMKMIAEQEESRQHRDAVLGIYRTEEKLAQPASSKLDRPRTKRLQIDPVSLRRIIDRDLSIVIRSAMKDQDLTSHDLAKSIGVSSRRIEDILSRNSHEVSNVLIKILSKLGVQARVIDTESDVAKIVDEGVKKWLELVSQLSRYAGSGNSSGSLDKQNTTSGMGPHRDIETAKRIGNSKQFGDLTSEFDMARDFPVVDRIPRNRVY